MVATLVVNAIGNYSRSRVWFVTACFPYPHLGTQALVRPGSPNSSISVDDNRVVGAQTGPIICRAKVVCDSVANPFDRDALSYKVNIIM